MTCERRTSHAAQVAAALLLATSPGSLAAQAGATPAMPGWMAGCWVEELDDRWTEECWTAARGGITLGSGRTIQGDRVRSWEVMQIIFEPKKSVPLGFYGAPGGEHRTLFTWQPGGEGVTFINAAHDYPQRIRYWREGDRLLAETSLLDGSNAKRWTYRRNASPR